jgi:ribosome-binding factor A
VSSARRHRSPRVAPSGFPRAWRVNEVLREVLAEELERMADADERLRLVTVTAVETASDLRRAVVYVGHLEPETAEALGERRRQLQATVSRQVRLKRTPRLEFATDPALAEGQRVEELIERIHYRDAGDRDAGDPDQGGAGT